MPSRVDLKETDLALRVRRSAAEAAHSAVSYQSKMARYLFEMKCLKGLEGFTMCRSLPELFIKHYEKVMALYDHSQQFLLGRMRQAGVNIRCKSGCTHCCCNMPAGVSAVELIYVYYGIHQIGKPSRSLRRCLEAEEVLAGVADLYRPESIFEPERPDAATPEDAFLKSYQRLEQPCPFLRRGLCQIYHYRPIACRMHFSASPPHWCRPSHFQHPNAVQFNLEPGECVKEALEDLGRCLRLKLSDMLVSGLLELMVNVMQLEQIRWAD